MINYDCTVDSRLSEATASAEFWKKEAERLKEERSKVERKYSRLLRWEWEWHTFECQRYEAYLASLQGKLDLVNLQVEEVKEILDGLSQETCRAQKWTGDWAISSLRLAAIDSIRYLLTGGMK